MLLVCIQPPSKDHRLCIAKESTKSIYVSSSLIVKESLLRQATAPFGIVPLTFDLTVPSTFNVLM